MGRALIGRLLQNGHTVAALARPASVPKLPAGCKPVPGDALDSGAYTLDGAGTQVHLVGVAHPAPSKAKQFRGIDLASTLAAVRAAERARVRHFIYVSVAHPAPVMHAYIAARTEAEEAIRAAGLNATILRPWYVLGPGHRWPLALLPAYWVLRQIPATRDNARRLALLTLGQMTEALVGAVENPAEGCRILEVPDIAASFKGSRKVACGGFL